MSAELATAHASEAETNSSAYQEDSSAGNDKFEPVGDLKRAGTFRQGGGVPTTICLSKAALGAGILSMSVHAAQVGLIYQFVCLIIGGLLTIASVRIIANASIATNSWSYEDICEELFHPAMSLLTGFVNVCNCIGSGAGYLIVCGQVFQVLSGTSDADRRLFIVLIGAFVCLPLSTLRHVGFLRHLAAASVAALVLLVVAVIWYLCDNGPDESITDQTAYFGPGGATLFAYMNTINNVVFAYNNQFNVPQLTGELTPEPTTKKMTMVALSTTALAFFMYGGVSIFGVLAFGVAENQRDSLVVDLTPARKNPLVFISLLAVMFSVITCFQFHIFPIRQFAAFNVRKARGRGANDECTDDIVMGRTITRWYDIMAALSSVVVIILIAVVITSLKTILDFVGAFASAYISYVVPPLWAIQVERRKKDFSWMKPNILGYLAFTALGIFFFVFGTFSAIRGATGGE